MNQRSLMSSIVVACLCAMVILPGCGGSSPAGTYEIDKDAMKAALKAQKQQSGPDDPMAELGMSMMMGMIDSMSITLTLNADGTASGDFTAADDTSEATGTWTLEGEQISITMAMNGQEPETATGTLKGDTLEIQPPADDPSPIVLVFKKRQ